MYQIKDLNNEDIQGSFYEEELQKHTFKIFLIKMPLINQHKGNGLENITMKRIRNFNKFNTNIPTITTTNLPVVEGEGLFSGLSSLLSSGVNLIKANSEVIKTVGSAGANVAGATKNIVDAVNSTKKVNAEIDQLKKIKDYRANKIKEKEKIITYTPIVPQTKSDKQLNQQQQNAIESLAKNLSKKRLGKGLRIY